MLTLPATPPGGNLHDAADWARVATAKRISPAPECVAATAEEIERREAHGAPAVRLTVTVRSNRTRLMPYNRLRMSAPDSGS